MPLHERSTELQRLDALVEQAARGTGTMALITGEAGIGKTALVRELVRRHPRLRPLCGWAEPATTVRPLGVMHDLAVATGGVLARAVRDAAPPWRLYEALLEDLVTIDALPLLWIEDAQWTDQATLDALRYLLRRCATLRLMLVITLRSDDARTAAVRERLLDTVPIDHWQEIRLQRLSQDTVERLATEAGVDGRGLFRLTKGNPLEVVSMLRWTRDSVPEPLTGLALRKLADLDPDSAALVRLLSVHPERIEAAWLRRLPQATPAALATCTAQNWLVEHDGFWSFEHELLRRAVRDALPPDERRRLHARLLELPLTAVQATLHAEGAGDRQRLAREAPVAAEHAMRAGAWDEAAGCWRLALEHAAPTPAQAAHWNDRLGGCLVHLGDTQGARTAFERAHRGWRALGDTRGMLRGMANALRWPLRVRLAMDLFRDAELDAELGAPEAADLPFERAILEIELGRRAAQRQEYDAARERIARVRSLAARLADVAQRTELRAWIAWLEGYHLCEVPADDMAALAATAERSNLEHIVGQVLLLRFTVAMMQFELDEAGRVVAEGLAHAARRDLQHLTERFRGPAAHLAFTRGRFDEAFAQVEPAMAEIRGAPMRAGFVAIAHDLALARTGRPRPSTPKAGTLDDPVRGGIAQVLVTALCHLAEIDWLSGDDHAAAGRLHEARELMARLGAQRPMRFLESVEWIDALPGPDRSPRRAIEPFGREADDRARTRGEVWLARGMPYQAAMVLASGGTASRRRAMDLLRPIGAHGAMARLSAVWRAAGLAGIPRGPNAHSRRNPAELTRREAQLLDLMVEGLGNPEIAERLHRSVRTVERHVSAILAKTGTRTRLEAAAWSRRERGERSTPARRSAPAAKGAPD